MPTPEGVPVAIISPSTNEPKSIGVEYYNVCFQAPTGIMNNERIKKAWNSYCGIIVLIDKKTWKSTYKI